MLDEHKIEGKIKISDFVKKVKKYKPSDIEATNHTFMRLNQKQRELYTERSLKEIILKQKPLEVGVQKNGNHSVIYDFKTNKYIKILLDFTLNKLYIVTFYILNKTQKSEFEHGKNIK